MVLPVCLLPWTFHAGDRQKELFKKVVKLGKLQGHGQTLQVPLRLASQQGQEGRWSIWGADRGGCFRRLSQSLPLQRNSTFQSGH